MNTQDWFWPYVVFMLIAVVLAVLTILHLEGTNPRFLATRSVSRVLLASLVAWFALGITVAVRVAIAAPHPHIKRELSDMNRVVVDARHATFSLV